MLVHHRGNHGGAGAKDAEDGGGRFTGWGHAEGGGGGKIGGGRGGGGRILKQTSVLHHRDQLRLWRKTWTETEQILSKYFYEIANYCWYILPAVQYISSSLHVILHI